MEAAKRLRVSTRSAASAAAVKKVSTELHAAIKAGKLSVHKAKKMADLPALERKQAVKHVEAGDIRSASAVLEHAQAKEPQAVVGEAAGERLTAAPDPQTAAGPAAELPDDLLTRQALRVFRHWRNDFRKVLARLAAKLDDIEFAIEEIAV